VDQGIPEEGAEGTGQDAEEEVMTEPPKCLGILGKLFGHKFSDFERYLNYCKRCAMPKGGWNK